MIETQQATQKRIMAMIAVNTNVVEAFHTVIDSIMKRETVDLPWTKSS